MSLYLLTTDPRTRALLNRNLSHPCITLMDHQHLERMRQTMHQDPQAVVIVDDKILDPVILSSIVDFTLRNQSGLVVLLLSQPRNQENWLYSRRMSRIITVQKPIVQEHLFALLASMGGLGALSRHLDPAMLEQVFVDMDDTDPYSAILVGTSSPMRTIRSIIRTVAKTFDCVHISGESGTGKEVVATLLATGAGLLNRMQTECCANISGALQDCTLFGHVRGAYTDAKEDRPGLVASAHNGILFLDEIETLHKDVQAKLLRLLETGMYRPVGSDTMHYSQFKLLTAANVPLETLIEEHLLREDLYNRINKLVIEIPPLRERLEDVPLLTRHLLQSKGEQRSLDAETFRVFQDYHWPGNVRELKSMLELLVMFTPRDALLGISHVPVKNRLKTHKSRRLHAFITGGDISCRTAENDPNPYRPDCGKPVDNL